MVLLFYSSFSPAIVMFAYIKLYYAVIKGKAIPATGREGP
jgi:hypothetical protein